MSVGQTLAIVFGGLLALVIIVGVIFLVYAWWWSKYGIPKHSNNSKLCSECAYFGPNMEPSGDRNYCYRKARYFPELIMRGQDGRWYGQQRCADQRDAPHWLGCGPKGQYFITKGDLRKQVISMLKQSGAQ